MDDRDSLLGRPVGPVAAHATALAGDGARDQAVAWTDLGDALRSAGRLDEARGAYLEAIRLAPGMARAHANLGRVLLQQVRYDEARQLLSRATKLEPGHPGHWEALAELHGRVEQFPAAIRCWERVLALTPDDRALPHLGLARALHELNRSNEAEAHYLAAVATEPGSAEARVELGTLLQERGKLAEAEAAFRAAVRLRPTCAMAYARLSSLLRDSLPDADLAAVAALLDDPATGPAPRARLLFALGLVCDARGEHPRAASCFREANALSLALTPESVRFQPAAHERFVDDLIRAFGPDFVSRTAGGGLDTRRMVFIVGLPRSGTTLLEQVLASHPRVFGAGELLLCRRLFDSLPNALGSPASPAGCAPLLDAGTLRRLAQAYLVRLRAVADDRAERVIDKMPENYMYLGLITAMFPHASVIHCRRDLRDVALSCWTADFRDANWANDPGHIAVKFRTYLRLMGHWRAVLPTAIHEVDYEEVVSDLEGVARRLLTALGLEWDPACLDFNRTKRAVRTSSSTQVRHPLYRRSVGRWTHYEREMADLFAALPSRAGRST